MSKLDCSNKQNVILYSKSIANTDFLFHIFGIEVEVLLQVGTSLFEVSVMRLHAGSISYSDAEVVVFVYYFQTFKFC